MTLTETEIKDIANKHLDDWKADDMRTTNKFLRHRVADAITEALTKQAKLYQDGADTLRFERDRALKALAAQTDYWSEIERIAKEVGIEPDNSLRSENMTEPRWSRNDPCDERLYRQDEVVDAIITRITAKCST